MTDMKVRFGMLRTELKISQEELGNAIGLSKSGVSSIESGPRKVTEKHIKLLSMAYNMNEEWMRTGEGPMFNLVTRDEAITIWASRITREDYDNDFVKKFANMLTKLDENDWKTIEKMMLLMENENSNK